MNLLFQLLFISLPNPRDTFRKKLALLWKTLLKPYSYIHLMTLLLIFPCQTIPSSINVLVTTHHIRNPPPILDPLLHSLHNNPSVLKLHFLIHHTNLILLLTIVLQEILVLLNFLSPTFIKPFLPFLYLSIILSLLKPNLTFLKPTFLQFFRRLIKTLNPFLPHLKIFR